MSGMSLACAQQQSLVLSENRAEKLGGVKSAEGIILIAKLINYINVLLKGLTIFRNYSIAFCFHIRFK